MITTDRRGNFVSDLNQWNNTELKLTGKLTVSKVN